MDIGGFIGRFHPLLVHLPIGMLLLAGMFEYFARKPKFQKLNAAVGFTLLIGALLAILSCVSGWLLANRGAYIERSLFLHRWLGVAVAVFASLCWLIKTERLKGGAKALKYLMVIMVVGIFATGHFGGNMTHGEDYLLEYAPAFLKDKLLKNTEQVVHLNVDNKDSILVYKDLLAPIFENECWKCHQPDNQLGGLDMTTKSAFLKGGDHGEVLEAGDAYESELFKRIVMPVSDRKSMPPFGLALSYNKVRLIEWWINNGASFEKTLGEFDVSGDIENLLGEEYGINFKQKNAIESIEVDAALDADLLAVKEKGFDVRELSEDSNLLDVSIKEKAEIDLLLKLKNQITWLSLNDIGLTDEDLKTIAELPSLTRVRLQNNAITDKGVKRLISLKLLESLNLNGTQISDRTLEHVKKMPALQTLYIFQTRVTSVAIKRLKKTRPDLEVVQGFKFEKPEEANTK